MKEVIFKIPDGVQIPDGTQMGESFEAMATFRLEANGEVCLKAVDGEPLDPNAPENQEVNDEANDDTSQPGPSSVLRQLLGGAQGGQ